MIIDALVIAAHPDDAEIGAGGTLLRLASLGYTTGILDLTRGELSTRGTPAERTEESLAAARLLGLSHRSTLDLGDGQLADTHQARSSLVAALRRLRPKLVLTHYWEQPHPDHVAAARLVRAAVYLAGLTKWDALEGTERHRPGAVAHFGLPKGTTPSFIVDISAWAEQKMAAIRCHRSQFHDPHRQEPETIISSEGFLERLDALQRAAGAAIGTRHGEGFFIREALALDDPVQQLSRTMDILF